MGCECRKTWRASPAEQVCNIVGAFKKPFFGEARLKLNSVI